GLHGANCHGDIAMAGDDDRRDVSGCLSQFGLEVQSAHFRKAYIQDEATGAVRVVPKKFFRRIKDLACEPNGFDQRFKAIANIRTVINDKDNAVLHTGNAHALSPHTVRPGAKPAVGLLVATQVIDSLVHMHLIGISILQLTPSVANPRSTVPPSS